MNKAWQKMLQQKNRYEKLPAKEGNQTDRNPERDNARRQEMQKELPNKINKIKDGINLATELRKKEGNVTVSDMNNLIKEGDSMKHWIKKYKKPLNLSENDYKSMRKDYNDARNAWQQSQGMRVDNTAAALSGLSAMYGAPLVDNVRYTTPEESKRMKQSVVEATREFLGRVDAKLKDVHQKLHSQRTRQDITPSPQKPDQDQSRGGPTVGGNLIDV